MKVTDLDMFGSRARALQHARARVERAQTIATSGLANVRGSDDPAWLDTNHRTKSEGLSNERSRRSLDTATARLQATDGTLGAAGDVLARLQEISVQGASDTYSASDRRALAMEVRSLKSATVAAANSRQGDGYLFAGSRTNTAPFDAAGAFTGDSFVMQVDAGAGRTTAAGIDPTTVFAPSGGVNVFATFDAIASALDNNDGAAVRAQLANVQGAITQVADGRAEAGDKLNAALRFSSWLDDADQRIADERATAVEADPLSAYSELATASSSLEAALKASVQAMNMSLVDFL